MAKASRSKAAATRGHESDHLGQKAHDKLTSWASDIGALPNESRRDRGGWDLFVSFPSLALDSSDVFTAGGPELCCFLQVKGTRGKRQRRSVSMENWLRAVTSPTPFFFVVLQYKGSDPEPEKAYVIHLDSALAERVAAKQWEEAGTLDLVWTASHECPCNATGIYQTIREQIGPDLHDYISRKIDHWRALCSTTPVSEVRVRMPGEREADDLAMAEWAIGLKTELRIAGYQVVDKRFGGERVHPREEGEITVSIGRVPSMAKARVSVCTDTENVTLDSEMYSSKTLFPFLPDAATRVRFATKYLSMVVGRDIAPTFSVHISPSETEGSLNQLAAHAKALRLLSSGGTISISVLMSGKQIEPITYKPAPVGAQELERAQDFFVFEIVAELYVRAGLPPSVNIDPWALLDIAPDVAAARRYLHPDDKPADVVLPGSYGEVALTDDAAFVQVMLVEALPVSFWLALVIRGPLVQENDRDLRLLGVPKPPRVFVAGMWRDLETEAKALRAAIGAQLREGGLDLLIGPAPAPDTSHQTAGV
jgi:hypothetical protein